MEKIIDKEKKERKNLLREGEERGIQRFLQELQNQIQDL